MTTLKRIGTLAVGMTDIKVKLVVTEHGYAVRITELFGRRLPLVVLLREVESSSTVDELFERYESRISVFNSTCKRDDGSNMDAIITIDGTSGIHKITITRSCDDKILIFSESCDFYITTTEDSILVTEIHADSSISRVKYTYDSENEVVSVTKGF